MKLRNHFLNLIARGVDRTPRLASLLGSIALTFIYGPAYAEMQLFLTWPGVTGPSIVAGHVGDIPLTSYSQNASNNGGIACGQVAITKQIDQTSPRFLGMVLTSKTAAQATVTFAQQTATTTTTFYTVVLRNVFPTSITQSDNTNGTVVETILLSATAFAVEFIQQLPDGSTGARTRFAFDCTNPQL
jgi:type VI protein secretion system component Hcp